MTTIKLDQILTDALALEAQAARERQAHIAAQCEAARAAIAVAFDGLWGEVSPYCSSQGDYWLNNAKTDVTAWWTVVSIPGYAPFIAVWRNGQNAGCSLNTETDPGHGWGSASFKDLPEFLLRQKREGERLSAEARAKQVAELRQKLEGYTAQRAATSLDADAALGELLALDPDHTGLYVKLHMDWQLWRNRMAEERREAQAQEERQARASAEYEAAYRAYWAELQRVLTANEARLDDLQAALDTPFTIYELTYAYSATDDDGIASVETGEAWSLRDDPDSDGYWSIIGNNGLARKRFYNLVSISAPVETRPGERKAYASVSISGFGDPYWRTLYFHPAADGEVIAAQAAALLDPWPIQPDMPEDLDDHTASGIRYKVANEGEVPF